MNYYGLFFTLGTKIIRLPVNPETLPDSLPGNNETYNILGVGEVTALRRPKQRTVDIDGLFPARVESYVLTPNKFMKPEEYIKFFRDAMYNRSILVYTPVRYMEDGTPFATDDLGFRCTVENFEAQERGAETGDYYFTLSIKEYRDYSPQTVKVQVKNLAQTVQKTVTTTPTRSVPDDELVVGTPVQVNGAVSPQLTTEPEPETQVSGQTAYIARVSSAKAKPYLLKGSTGSYIGWAPKPALKPVKQLVNRLNAGGYGDYLASTPSDPVTNNPWL